MSDVPSAAEAVSGAAQSTDRAGVSVRPGPTNSLRDVAGLGVGHATLRRHGWLTGTTVVLAPDEGMVAGVDVRGGGPGTRETDLLDPRNIVERVHAICLSGGSAFGLAAADGVMRALFESGVGLSMGAPGEVVPLVPGAVVFDLGRGGVFANRPDEGTGRAAYAAAKRHRDEGFVDPADAPLEAGVIGAGTGAKCGGFKGGIGSASAVLADGTTVAALIVLNALGEPVDPATGELYARRFLLPGELVSLGIPGAADVAAARASAATAPPQPVGRP
ncbi:MAG: P1 family peptidase, partial [Micrococcales bacterium]|nr:P1 family peptidase [Micrococcales bacterium]